MEKEKLIQRPEVGQSDNSSTIKAVNESNANLDAYKRLNDYRNRETEFLKTLNEVIKMDCKQLISSNNNITSVSNKSDLGDNSKVSECDLMTAECENFLQPLLTRAGPSISAALVANDAFEQLNRLHGFLDQMLILQEQNYQMRRHLRDIKTLCELKKLQKKGSNEILSEAVGSENEFELDSNFSILTAILADGNGTTIKKNIDKRHRERSKSTITEDTQLPSVDQDIKPWQQRRASAFPYSKSKVSKWTKVKAAFKWERANVPVLAEGKSSDSGIGLTPVTNEVARYLRVPSVPCPGSSADSVFSSSSGHLLSGGSIPTPGTISSASSLEDIGNISEDIRHNRDSSKSDSRCESRGVEDENRRSRSLDGDNGINQALINQNKNKTPWRKVKDIIQTHRGSIKEKPKSLNFKPTSFTCSRGASPYETIDVACYSDVSPNDKRIPPLNLTFLGPENECIPSSPMAAFGTVSPIKIEHDCKLGKGALKSPRKTKIVSDFQSLPEGMPVELKIVKKKSKPPLCPLTVSSRQDSSDVELAEWSCSPLLLSKSSVKSFKLKKSFASVNSSVPSSPSRHSEFFGEFESEELSSGDFSEPSTPNRRLSSRSSLLKEQEEINERYIELREKLSREFEAKKQEWEKIRAACSTSTSSAYQWICREDFTQSRKNTPPKILEENLSADFKKKLHKWRVKKQGLVNPPKDFITVKETEQKKIDWNLWKTGQLKLEGQGLTPLPDQKDLPEDFQRKLEEWKKIKSSNAVSVHTNTDSIKKSSQKLSTVIKTEIQKRIKDENDRSKVLEKEKLERLSKLKAIVTEPPAKEIEVQTSKGVLKFEGISRKFTRKLYEWEKARGIGPESSTFALLHPGYRPLDVGNGSHDANSSQNTSTIFRSLSLDSVSPNVCTSSISHQPSSLSLNDADDFKDSNIGDRRISSNPEISDLDLQDEPEAVIVEVEDDIIETAAPLFTATPIVEQQTPVYKYEVSCKELCPGRETVLHQGLLNRSEKLSPQTFRSMKILSTYLQDQHEGYRKNIRQVQEILKSVKECLPDLERGTKGGSSHAIEAFEAVKKMVNEIILMLDTLTQSEKNTKEMIAKNTRFIDNRLSSLQKSIDLVCKFIESKNIKGDIIPNINISDDSSGSKQIVIVSTTPTVFHSEIVNNELKPILIPSVLESSTVSDVLAVQDFGQKVFDSTIHRNLSNCSKKKRLRKIGSRQNSKTDSDSDEAVTNLTIDTPRRLKRKTSKVKLVVDENQQGDDKKYDNYVTDEATYKLKTKPSLDHNENSTININSNVIESAKDSYDEINDSLIKIFYKSPNIFVKTKRKVFKTDEQQNTIVTEIKKLDSLNSSESKCYTNEENIIDNQNKSVSRVVKEPSPTIRNMIAKLNHKTTQEDANTQTISKSLAEQHSSPIVARRPKFLNNLMKDKLVLKSSSAGEMGSMTDCTQLENNKARKSSSEGAILNKNKPYKKLSKNIEEDFQYMPSHIAFDSLRIINKSYIPPKIQKIPTNIKKEHLFRKNKEKNTSLFNQPGCVKRINSKNSRPDLFWTKSNSTLMETTSQTQDKYISKETKPVESISLTNSSVSAPATPTSLSEESSTRPKTPLNERALKLKKAKEDFLRGHPVNGSSNIQEAKTELLYNKRLSQTSVGSEQSIDHALLIKSASVGVLESCSSDYQQKEEDCDSLPRTVMRSGKLTSKFGFSSLASKFRKVKMRRASKDLFKLNTVSTLCRHSLAIDVMREGIGLLNSDTRSINENNKSIELEKKDCGEKKTNSNKANTSNENTDSN